MSNFFIKRPIVAMVIAILTVIVGAVSRLRVYPSPSSRTSFRLRSSFWPPTWVQMRRHWSNRSRRRSSSKSMASTR